VAGEAGHLRGWPSHLPEADTSHLPTSLTLRVADVALTLTARDPAWLAPLAARYAGFLAPEADGWRVELRADGDAPLEPAGWARHAGPVTRYHVLRYRGEIDLAARRAWAGAPDEAHAASAVERCLVYILMQALPRAGDGLLLHAAGVALGGRAYAFCGPSGAGKTTVARLLQDRGDLFGDENMVLRLTPAGVELLSTPFWGASAPPDLIRRANHAAPLAAIFVLEKAPDFALRTLSAGEAVAALLATEKVATERVDSATAWLEVAGRLLGRVPAYALRFRPSEELSAFLSRHEGGKLI
jgi:hypothetical protein